MTLLRRLAPHDVPHARVDPIDAETLAGAALIVDDVRARGEVAVREHATRLGDLTPGAPLFVARGALQDALAGLDPIERGVLERTAERIRAFAVAQRQCLRELDAEVPGGRAGHSVAPMQRAGCYAPGGRFPLPSSVLMTAVTARAAGVESVWVASPRPAPVILAAAALADADGMLVAGGAQAIAALAYGCGPLPPSDVVVGPGNRWVTAAKQRVAGHVAIDMLAGPSELVVLADDNADPALVAADLLAQAEHDDDALPVLVTTSAVLPLRVEQALEDQLRTLPTAATARRALAQGFCVHCDTLEEAAEVVNRLAPEHLELALADSSAALPLLRHYGALFIGAHAAEVLGDYGIGPNHVLPTSGGARFTGGLSVLTFLRVRTWLRVDAPDAAMARDAADLGRLEGLEAHARAAERRWRAPS